MSNPVLSIVIPCYNEEKVLPVTSWMFLTIVCGLFCCELTGRRKNGGCFFYLSALPFF